MKKVLFKLESTLRYKDKGYLSFFQSNMVIEIPQLTSIIHFISKYLFTLFYNSSLAIKLLEIVFVIFPPFCYYFIFKYHSNFLFLFFYKNHLIHFIYQSNLKNVNYSHQPNKCKHASIVYLLAFVC